MAEGTVCLQNNGDDKADPTKRIQRHRKWITREGSKNSGEHPGAVSFTVASYNVLSQHLLLRHLELYQKCSRDHLQWEFRKTKLLEEIDNYSPDILCLQEVHKHEFKRFFQQNLNKRGYNGIYKQRPGIENEDGCATFYKTNMFTLVETRLIDYGRYDGNCEGKNNVAILLALKFNSREYDAILCVANTHILYNPRRGDIKLTQLIIFLAEIYSFCCRYPHFCRGEYIRCPCIVCGDFNVVPQSCLHNFLCRGKLLLNGLKSSALCGLARLNSPTYNGRYLLECCLIPYQITDDCRFKLPGYNYGLRQFGQIKHLLNLFSAYQHGDKPVATSFHFDSARNLDYIFYSAGRNVCGHEEYSYPDPVSESGLHLIECLEVPSAADDIGPMPNEWNGSDHIMIMSRFLFS